MEAATDTRKFDGPWDKQLTRKANREVAAYLKSDLAIRVPGPENTYGTMEEVEAQPGDTGRRWTHLVKDTPITFDAGSCALWVNPGGWRCLLCYQHDDPTYGLNIAIFDPSGAYRIGAIGVDGYEAMSVVEDGMP